MLFHIIFILAPIIFLCSHKGLFTFIILSLTNTQEKVFQWTGDSEIGTPDDDDDGPGTARPGPGMMMIMMMDRTVPGLAVSSRNTYALY